MGNRPAKIFEAHIAEDVEFGEGVYVGIPSNLYGCKIGNNCRIGPFVEIQKGVDIGDRTRIQSHSFICDRVTIGSDCFVGHGTIFTNDKFSKIGRPSYIEVENWEPTRIGNNVTIGNNATILPVSICDNVIIGAGAVVTRSIERPGIYAGVPAKYLKAYPTYKEPS